jgi:hypothetical protein
MLPGDSSSRPSETSPFLSLANKTMRSNIYLSQIKTWVIIFSPHSRSLLNCLFYLSTIKHTPIFLQQNTKKDQNKAIYHKVLAEQLRIPLCIQAFIPTQSKLVNHKPPLLWASSPPHHAHDRHSHHSSISNRITKNKQTNKKIKSDDWETTTTILLPTRSVRRICAEGN